MTQKLEELFDVDPTKASQNELIADTDVQLVTNSEDQKTAMSNIDKINDALPSVKGLEASDGEMDSLASKALESYDDLMNLGMQVEARYASDILSVAGTMLGHAITAKTAKATKKLKMIELQLKNRALDQKEYKAEEVVSGEGQLLDRNEILKALRNQSSDSGDK